MTEEKKMDKMEKLKEDYSKLQKQHKLPCFDDLNREFDIEKLKPSSFMLREIRHSVIDKMGSVMKLLETFMNPTSAPVFMFKIIKNLNADAKKEIENIYNEFTSIQLGVLKLDIEYNERGEAEFLREIYAKWQDYKKRLITLTDNFEKAWHANSKKTEREYFG
jgi:hypothetical protein